MRISPVRNISKKTVFVYIPVLIFFLVVSAAFFFHEPVQAMQTFGEVMASYTKSDAVLLDRHGEVIHDMRVDPKGRRLDWTRLRDISPALTKAVIRSEDRKFYEHGGVDWMALAAAVVENVMGESKRGASTITMQLASMLDPGLRPGKVRRTLSQKWDQISAARELDSAWKKDEILEAYLNLVTFRGELQGIGAASRGLFGKSPDGLDEREALILAALIRAPNAAPDKTASRACALGVSLQSQADCRDIKALASEALSAPYRITFRHNLAPHVAAQLLKNGRKRAASTLDGRLQRFVSEALAYQLRSLTDRNVHDGAALVADNRTGEILAYVGNTGVYSSARHVDGVTAMRQAGSTLKPFLYALAIENGLITAASLIEDSAVNVPAAEGIYMPQNYDNDFKGLVTARTALSSSLNIPAVKTLMLVGPDDFGRRLRALGFRNLKDGDYYGLSMALGSVDINLYDLVNAYRTMANGGRLSAMTVEPRGRGKSPRQVMSRGSAFIVSDVLSDRSARSLTFGFENPLSTRFWTAVKTGTSKDMRDNWCVGFSDRYTVGVWVGNFSGAAMWNVSGISGAAPVWLDIMNQLHRNRASSRPAQPKDVVAERFSPGVSSEPERTEYFIRGSEPVAARQETAGAAGRTKIVYPADRMIIAVDPDIPAENNLVFFEASSGGDFTWLLNNGKVGDGAKMISWRPRPGLYKLSLRDRDGGIIDSISFEVRGRPAAVADNPAEAPEQAGAAADPHGL
jgi:penicillin-binding protein 1C